MDTTEKVILTIIICAVLLTAWTKCSVELSGACRDQSWRDQIVDHGAAEYYLDEKHDRQWRWKDIFATKGKQ